MDITEKLRLIANGFEFERTYTHQARSAVPALREAINEIEKLRSLQQALQQHDTITNK